MVVSTATLGGMVELGHGLAAHCQNRACGHFQTLDMAALIERYGEAGTTAHGRIGTGRLRCSRCGGTNCGLTMTTPHNPRF